MPPPDRAAYRAANAEKIRAYEARPEVKARKAAYAQRPDVKAKREAHNRRADLKPQRDAWWREYYSRPEVHLLARGRANARRKDPEVARATAVRLRAWKASHASVINANTAHRRAAKLRATPAWADQAAIGRVYAMAQLLTTSLGEAHHVDHIVPLRSALVCGLHVPANLEVILASDNMSKQNRYWPDMP